MKKVILVLIIAIVLLGLVLDNWDRNKAPDISKVCFPSACVNVTIADTPSERGRGLMEVENLSSDEGMLFIFEKSGNHPFWMKNTLIPLDMIWINESKSVVHVQEAQPCYEDDCASYTSATDAIYVLEVNGGFAARNNIAIGTKVDYS